MKRGDKRTLLLIIILSSVACGVAWTTISILYDVSLEQQKARLTDVVRSQSSLIEAVAEYDSAHSKYLMDEHPDHDPVLATLSQIQEAHTIMEERDQSAELTLARLEDSMIVFILNHLHENPSRIEPIPFGSDLAEPMRRALSEEIGGTVVGLDYRGAKVLAAYEPVSILNLGIVAKVDIWEVEAPFVRAGVIAGVVALLLILLGSSLFLRIGGQMNRQLEESESKYKSLFSQAANAVVVINPDTLRFAEFNKRAHQAFGYSRNEFSRLTLDELLAGSDEDSVRLRIAQIVNQGEQMFETQMKTHDDQVRDVLISAKSVKIQGESLVASIWSDITERKQAEQETKLYSNIAQNMQVGLYVYHLEDMEDDRSLRLIATNQAATDFTGVSANDIIGKTIDDNFPGLRDKGIPQKYAEVVRSSESIRIEEIYYEDDRVIGGAFSIRAFPLPNQCVGIAFENITERKKLNEEKENLKAQLFQSDKLASVGQLAAGVAHEINNPVGYICSNLNTMNKYLWKIRGHVNESEPVEEKAGDLDELMVDFGDAIAESLEGADRVKRIVGDLMSFSRADTGDMAPTDLKECIESTLNIVWNQLKYHCTVEKKIDDLPEIECCPGQINQVLLNLLVNAGQATKGQKGVIKIGARVEGDKVVISVRDNGVGIPEENLRKIFDPFFTTKGVGEGTGLGLSLSYGIIKDHGGLIELKSTVGEGTEFRVSLPIHQNKPTLEPKEVC